jgi:potassium efflux system protein
LIIRSRLLRVGSTPVHWVRVTIGLLFALLLAVAGRIPAADSPAPEKELESVHAAEAAPPEAQVTRNAESRNLLEGIEYAVSRQLAAESALAVSQAQRQALDRQMQENGPTLSGEVDPQTIDKLLAEAISAERDLVGATTVVEVLEDQETAEHERLKQLMAQERAEIEDATMGMEQRTLTRLQMQQASATVRATTAELANAVVVRDIKQREAALARRRALAAAELPLDEMALADYLKDKRTTLERLTQDGLDRMTILASRQRALADARQARDAANTGGGEGAEQQASWQFEAERTAVDRLELETLARRINIEAAEVAVEIWNARAEMMVTGSLGSLAQAERAIERSLERAAVVRERFISTQGHVQEVLDELDVLLQKPTSGKPGHVWLKQYQRELRAIRLVALRALENLDELQVFLDGSRFHLNHLKEHRSLIGSLRDARQQSWRAVQTVWNYEILTIEDTIEVNGEKITGQMGVTVKKIVIALLLVTVGIWAAAVAAGFVRNRLVRRGVSETAAALTYRLLNLVGVTVLVVTALTVVKIPLTVLGFVGGALALGVGLGAQALVNNFISGMILLMERPVKIGDVIDIDGVRGTVTKIASRYSQIRRFDGVDLLIPNSTLLERQVENLTREDRNHRLTLRVGVAYGSPTRNTSDCLLAAAKEHGRVLDKPPPFVLFEDFGDSALVFSLNVWVRLHSDVNTLVTMSDLRYMIERNLREAEIVVAFPQRDVHVDVRHPLQIEVLRTGQHRLS